MSYRMVISLHIIGKLTSVTHTQSLLIFLNVIGSSFWKAKSLFFNRIQHDKMNFPSYAIKMYCYALMILKIF